MYVTDKRGINSKLKNAKAGEKISVGDNIFLQVLKTGRKVWRMRYRKPATGFKSLFIIGDYPDVSYTDALAIAEEAKADVRRGIDPNDKKTISKTKAITKENTFEAIAREWHHHRQHVLERWKREETARKVIRSLELHVFPHIGNLPIDEITPPMLLNIIEGMQEAGKTNVVSKVNQRINAVFEFAILRKRLVANPANGLVSEIKPHSVKHHPHLEPDDIPVFFHDLQSCNSGDVSKIAVEFTMRTLARTGEVRFAKWCEFDMKEKVWHPTPDHRKNAKAHVVPLSDQVMELLERLHKMTGKHEYLFLTYSRNKPMSENAMLDVLKRMGWKGRLTVHGLRGTGSTILNEAGFRADIVEKALSHTDTNKVRGAYNHAKYLEERREMLQWYSDYLDSLRNGADVIPINRNKAV